jgi:hypothetical protein
MTDEASLLDLVRGTGSERAVVAAYAEAIRAWPQNELLHGPYWREVNDAIIERWSVARLQWIKRQAWRRVDD